MRNQYWTWIVVILAALALTAGDAVAKKGGGGGKPGGDSGGDPGNTTPPDIAFTKVGNKRQGTAALWTMQDDGSGVTQITDAEASRASWSPDGSQLSLWGNGFGSGQGPGVYVTDVDGQNLVRLTNHTAGWYRRVEWCPVAAPDGTYKLAFSEQVDLGGGQVGYDIFLINVDGTERRNVSSLVWHNGARVNMRTNAWSPDGRRLLCFVGGDVDGFAVIDLDYDAAGDLILPTSLLEIPSTTSSVNDGEWAKTGDKVVFHAPANGLGDLFVIDFSDPNNISSAVNITNTADIEERFPSWSPDDAEVVCSVPGGLVVYDVASGAGQQLGQFKGSNGPSSPVWKRATP